MKKRRVIRKVPVTTGDYFESHVWPVNLAIIVTAGFVSGIAIAYLWGGALWVLIAPCLVLIALVTLVATVVATLIDRRWVRRTLQLALAVAVFIHLAMFAGLAGTNILEKTLPDTKKPNEAKVARKPVKIADYAMRQTRPDEEVPPWMEPVPTPAPEERPTEIETPTPLPMPEEPETPPEPTKSAPEPTPTREPQPEAPSRQTPGEAVPKFAATPSQLSRQTRDVDRRPSTQVAAADAPAQQANATNAPQAQATPLARQSNEPAPASSSQPEVETPEMPTEAAVARAEPRSAEAPTPTAADASLARRSDMPAENLPRVDLAAEAVPIPQSQSQAPATQSMVAEAARTETTAPATTRTEVEPEETNPTPDAEALARRSEQLEERPQVAQVETPSPTRQERTTPRPATTAVADVTTPSAAASEAPTQPAMQVADASLERTNDAAAAPTRTESADVPAPSAPTERTVARSDTAQSAPEPAPAAASASPSRASLAADRPVTATVAAAQAPASEAAAGELAPGATELPRTAAASAVAMNDSAEPSEQNAPSAVQPLARPAPAPSADPQLAANAATPERTERAAAATPATATAQTTPSPSAAQSEAPSSAVAAAATPTTKAETGSALARSENAAPANAAAPSDAPQAADLAQRLPQSEPAPGVAQAPSSMARTETTANEPPGVASTSVPTESAEGPPTDAAIALAPGESDLEKETGESSLASTVQSSLATEQPSEAEPNESSVARAAPGETAPSLASPTDDVTSPTRTATFAASPVSPENVDRPALAESQRSTDAPQLEAAQTSLARSFAGTAGTGESANVGRTGEADPTQSAPTPSGSVARAQATQTGPEGPAVTPSEMARVSQSRADQQTPASPIAATNVPLPNGAGSSAPSERSASSSAALTTALADASPGAVTAATGSVDLDMGASRIVPEAGASHGAGGGQPALNLRSQAEPLARSDAGGAPRPAIASAVEAPEASAPRGIAGSTEPSQPADQATALARTSPGTASAIAGGPSAAAEPGTAGSAAPAQSPGERAIARAAPREAIPSETLAAGGAPATAGALAREPRRADLASAPSAPGGTMVAEVPAAAASGGTPGGESASPTPAGPAATAVARASTGSASGPAAPPAVAEPGGVASSSPAAASAGGGPARVEGSAAAPSIGAIASASPTLDRAGPSSAARSVAPSSLAPVASTPGGAPSTDGPTVEALAREAGGPAKTETGQTGGAIAASNVSAPGAPAAASGGERIAAAAIGRAESSSGAPGPALPGGGANSARTAREASLPAFAQAPTIELAGAPGGAAEAEMSLPQAGPADASRLSGGAQTTALAAPGGVPQVDDLSAPRTALAGAQAARPRTGAGGGDSPELGEVGEAPTLARASTGTRSPATAIAAATVPVPAQTGTGSQAAGVPGPSDMGDLSRQSAGGALALVPAPEGMGGLGMRPAPAAGVDSPRATTSDVPILIATDSRFPGKQSRGNLSLDVTATFAAPSFSGRNRPEMTPPGGDPTGDLAPRTEKAVEEGVAFLVRHQMPDGSWSLDRFGAGRIGYESENASMVSDTAATALALLAIQGAGYTHRDHRYRESVQRGLAWLVSHQQPNGDLYVPQKAESGAAWLYSHGIASLALCEAYGMTQDPALREPAQKALDFVVASQEKRLGGWRYTPGYGADTSVSGWMAMALKSGDLAGLDVPEATYDGVKRWLDYSQVRGQPHLFRYNAFAADTPEQRHGRSPTASMTSVGLLMRMYYGWRRDNPQLLAGANYLLENLPEHGTAQQYREGKNPRDTYYWYYATQVMYHMGGEHWKRWHERLHPMLLETQIQEGPLAGSWNPLSPIPDRWGPHGGRIYVTAMNLLSLEVEYRHLPLYEETAK
ncbi:MAG TPA: hypothetical protein VGN57_04960 [Pirellulaceae bacterium]|jgi:hypothetical protein|nr:hypothetical protein [Pirellulaceae bacterium]